MMPGFLLLVAAQASAEPPLIPAFFTGESLYEICTRPNAGQCSMYVAGVVDGLFYANSEHGGPSLCRGPLDNREAADLVVRYLEANPGVRSAAAAVGVRQALAERLNCAANADDANAG